MKSYIIFSDIHGNREAFNKLLPLINENSGAFFAGDGASTFRSSEIKGELYAVCGNNDFALYPREQLVKIGNHTVLLTHGDNYGVRASLQRLKYRALEVGANVIIFGHTHVPEIVEEDGLLFINPGSCDRFCAQKTFAYITFGEKPSAFINEKTLNFL